MASHANHTAEQAAVVSVADSVFGIDETHLVDWLAIGTGSRTVVMTDDEIAALLRTRSLGLKSIREKVASPVPAWDRDIITLAREQLSRDGETEIDDSSIVSEGNDNGAYVLAWVWCSFEGTALDKEVDADPGDGGDA
ncbi:hypothetical protein [Burkholderia cepacia]|uniref:hypothetical protein n=1 Tax=Burkholderia cepacia TaxID=292 RepID=UPI002AB72BC5|nr:hypothetical protein [Burkholderia cepacia]